jgi:LPXTG-motif cell wall-anchored protein
MKKSVLFFSVIALLYLGGMNNTLGQEQPKPKKDTVNMDTDAKPTFYYATEDDKNGGKGKSGKSSVGTMAIIAGAVVVVVGAAGFFFLRKKK